MTEGRDEYGDYSVDEENQPGAEDSGAPDDVEDELDRGYSPPDRPSPDYGNTPWEEAHGETLGQRLEQEEPDPDPRSWEDDDADEQDEAEPDPEVGDERAGRLVDPDQGFGEDTEKDLVGDDVGIDGGAASAEEAAMHVIPDAATDDL